MSKPSMEPSGLPVEPKGIIWNPSPEHLRELTELMPNTRVTRYNNTNTQTRVDARSKLSTYVVTDTPEHHDSQTITREEYGRVSKIQDEYIRGCEMIVVEGFIGNDPEYRVPARLVIEREAAIAPALDLDGVEAAVARDAEQPGAQLRALLELRQVAVRLHEHLLVNVVHQGLVAQHLAAEPVHRHAVAPHQRVERRAPLPAIDEREHISVEGTGLRRCRLGGERP